MHGLGLSLPKGEALLVPRFCDVHIGQAIHWQGERDTFMQQLQDAFAGLGATHQRLQEDEVAPSTQE
jgi:hypothetical protein